MRRACSALLVVAGLLSGAVGAAQTKRALLIGIDLYQPKGTTPQCPKDEDCSVGRFTLVAFDNLVGPVNDAELMAEVLTNPKFGFPSQQVRLLLNPDPEHPPGVAAPPGVEVLTAGQTTRSGILAAMQKYLVDEPQPGDTVVFYYAGHGSLQKNSLGNGKLTVQVPVPGSNPVQEKSIPVDSTIVPSDAWTGTLDVLDHEMTRIFNAALDKGVRLTVIFDSCHSGMITRGEHHGRSLLFDGRDVKDASVLPVPSDHVGNGAVVLSAAQQDQEAGADLPPDGTKVVHLQNVVLGQRVVHGYFTYALVKALMELPANVPAAVVFERVKGELLGSYAGQVPEIDAGTARLREPLLPGAGGADMAGTVWAAALQGSLDSVGNATDVVLDIGSLSGIGVGSVFEQETTVEGGKIDLTVKALNGIDSSTVTVSPAGATVEAGDMFVLKKLVRAQSLALHVWMPPANLTETQLTAAAAVVTEAKLESVGDPAEEPWTAELNWNGSVWTLHPAQEHDGGGTMQPSKLSKAVDLGATLTAAALLKHLKPGAKVWVNLPPSRELAAQLKMNEPGGAVQAADSMATAEYVLTGSMSAGGPQYAWYHEKEYEAGPAEPVNDGHSPGCSMTSPYPVRSDWQPVGSGSVAQEAGALDDEVDLLAKGYVWMQRSKSPEMASANTFYHLQLRTLADKNVVTAGSELHTGDKFQWELQSSQPIAGSRWVYLLDIDCRGHVTTVYPKTMPGKSYPDQGDDENNTSTTIHLPLVSKITGPFGEETLVLLSTSAPLTVRDMDTLESKQPATRGGDPFAWSVGLFPYRNAPAQVPAGK